MPSRPEMSPADAATRPPRARTPAARRRLRLAISWLFAFAAAPAWSAGLLQPLVVPGATSPAPWHPVGLPSQTKPFTQFRLVDIDGERALRVEAERSYGNLVHPVAATAQPRTLAWRWRLDEPNAAVDLRQREGDDTALKVCVLYDEPLDRVPFMERQLLRVARSSSSEPLPAASVCYVWDARLPVGTAIDSPFTRRVRYIVLRTEGAPLHQWVRERRDLAADFRRLYGDESPQVPPVIGIAVGADADNTGARSVGHISEITLE